MIEEIKIDQLEELIHEMMIKIQDTHPTNSAEGNPIEIENAAAAPLVKCVTVITGSQSGSGAPSPTNIRTITAFSGCEIEVTDEDENTTTYASTYSSIIYQGSEDVVTGKVTCNMPVIDLGDLTWSYNSTGEYFSTALPDWSSTDRLAICSHFEIVLWPSAASALINADDKKAYYQTSNKNLFVKYSDYNNDVDAFKAAMSGVKFAYVLAEPAISTVTVSNAPVSAVHGYNKIESSTGDMEVTYITEEFEPLVPTT